MIQLSNLEEIEAKDIPNLIKLVQPELDNRKRLWERYHRKINVSYLMCDGEKSKTKVPFEKYITDTASGFLGGKEPTYTVQNTADEEKKNIIKKVLDKIVGRDGYKDELEAIINNITNYNDDGAEHYNLIKDLIMVRACYEIQYENNDNELVYARLDPLQTCAIWDYSTPINLIGLVRTWQERQIDGTLKRIVEIIDKNGTRRYNESGSNTYTDNTDETQATENTAWGDVPAFAVELEEGLFEPVVDLISAYEQLIQNTRNTFQYNDEAKLAISGYTPENEITIKDDKGNDILNPARQKEDEFVRRAPVMYFNENGDAKWLIKDVVDTAIQNTLKTYIDLIMMNSGVPNTFDLGFTNADNASALDRKFFSLITMTTNMRQELRKAYLRRWELLIGRINLKKQTDYDFRDIVVELPYNMPANESELIDMWTKLRGLVSDETIVNRLPLNLEYASEKLKMDNEANEAFQKEVENMKAMGGDDNELPENRQETDRASEEVQAEPKEV